MGIINCSMRFIELTIRITYVCIHGSYAEVALNNLDILIIHKDYSKVNFIYQSESVSYISTK